MPKFRKKPVVIEAQLFDGSQEEAERLRAWVENAAAYRSFPHGGKWLIDIGTLEGRITAEPGDYIICGVKGEFYPCKPDIFAATYESVSERDALEQENQELRTRVERGATTPGTGSTATSNGGE